MLAETVEQSDTIAVPLTVPKMAPAETVSMNAAAMGTTCSVIIAVAKTAYPAVPSSRIYSTIAPTACNKEKS